MWSNFMSIFKQYFHTHIYKHYLNASDMSGACISLGQKSQTLGSWCEGCGNGSVDECIGNIIYALFIDVVVV